MESLILLALVGVGLLIKAYPKLFIVFLIIGVVALFIYFKNQQETIERLKCEQTNSAYECWQMKMEQREMEFERNPDTIN